MGRATASPQKRQLEGRSRPSPKVGLLSDRRHIRSSVNSECPDFRARSRRSHEASLVLRPL